MHYFLRRCGILFSLLLSIILFTSIFTHDALADPYDSNDWMNTLTPYFWISDITGDVTVKGRTAEFDMDFSDLARVVDFAFMMRFELWSGKWGFLTDIAFLHIGKDVGLQHQVADVDVDILSDQLTVDVGIGYYIGEIQLTDNSRRHSPRVSFDLLGGGRFSDINIGLSFYLDPNLGEIGETAGLHEMDTNWFEIFVGGRATLYATERLSCIIRSDYGGFGLGSDHTWNFMANLEYRLFSGMAFSLGYRVKDISVEEGSGEEKFGYDVTMHGPEFSFRFFF